jgi:cell filamentation protein
MIDRYDTSGNTEGLFQPGSDDKVLLNQLGIICADEIDEIELDLLVQLTAAVLDEVTEDQIIKADDLCEWHRRWLGQVNKWAGRYRTVNMGKSEFQFVVTHLIPQLMHKLEDSFLLVYMPCKGMQDEQLIDALAKERARNNFDNSLVFILVFFVGTIVA